MPAAGPQRDAITCVRRGAHIGHIPRTRKAACTPSRAIGPRWPTEHVYASATPLSIDATNTIAIPTSLTKAQTTGTAGAPETPSTLWSIGRQGLDP